jgi:pimeloyl-ACP methyl ester carboxylesterase
MRIKINGLTVFIEGDRNKPTILFVHAFPHDHRMWNKQVNALSREFCVITYDVRGFGESSIENGQFTMEMYVDDLINIVDEIGGGKPILAGLSMGGYISLRVLEKASEKFSGAVLMDTRSEADDNAGKLKRANAIKEISENGIIDFATEFVKGCVSDETLNGGTPAFNQALEIAKSQDPVGVKGALLAMVSRTDTTDGLTELNIPVLVLVGEHDKLTPPETMKAMADKIPDSHFMVIPNAGHLSNMENPGEVNAAILKFAEIIFS